MEKKIQLLEEKMENLMLIFNEIKTEINLLKQNNEKTQKNKIPISIWKEFSFVPINNDAKFILSNNNKTLELKSGNDWRGFRCDPPEEIFPRTSFSIKIENTSNNNFIFPNQHPSNIIFGWCLKNANSSKGFYVSNASFGLYLFNGNFYNRGINNDNINSFKVRGQIWEIYSSVINIEKNTIEFYLNGSLLGYPRSIDLKKEEISLLCPFVDLYNKGDKVTIVEFNNFNWK